MHGKIIFKMKREINYVCERIYSAGDYEVNFEYLIRVEYFATWQKVQSIYVPILF